MSGAPFLSVSNLSKTFVARGKPLRVLENIGFEVARGEVVGLVGESGSGKTTIGRCILRLIEPDAGASIRLDGAELTSLDNAALRALEHCASAIDGFDETTLMQRAGAAAW